MDEKILREYAIVIPFSGQWTLIRFLLILIACLGSPVYGFATFLALYLHEQGHLRAIRFYGLQGSIGINGIGIYTASEKDLRDRLGHGKNAIIHLGGPLMNLFLAGISIGILTLIPGEYIHQDFWQSFASVNALIGWLNTLPLWGVSDGSLYFKRIYSSLIEKHEKPFILIVAIAQLMATLIFILIMDRTQAVNPLAYIVLLGCALWSIWNHWHESSKDKPHHRSYKGDLTGYEFAVVQVMWMTTLLLNFLAFATLPFFLPTEHIVALAENVIRFALTFLIALSSPMAGQVGWVVATLGLLVALFLSHLLLHELGHRIGAWFTGIRIKRLVVGHPSSQLWFKFYIPAVFSWEGEPLLIEVYKSLPVILAVESENMDLATVSWWRNIVFFAAGPLMNIVVSVAMLTLTVGFSTAVTMVAEILWGCLHFLASLVTFQNGDFLMSMAPATMTKLTDTGLHGFWATLVLLNLFIAAANILPLPALDGGFATWMSGELALRRLSWKHLPLEERNARLLKVVVRWEVWSHFFLKWLIQTITVFSVLYAVYIFLPIFGVNIPRPILMVVAGAVPLATFAYSRSGTNKKIEQAGIAVATAHKELVDQETKPEKSSVIPEPQVK